MFLSKIFVESQDLGSNATEAAQEEIVSAIVEQRNHFSNKFDDFQALIEELKSQSLIARQRFELFEAQRVKQAKVRAEQAKIRFNQAKVRLRSGPIRPKSGLIRLRSMEKSENNKLNPK